MAEPKGLAEALEKLTVFLNSKADMAPGGAGIAAACGCSRRKASYCVWLPGKEDVPGCRCWGLRASASRDLEDALLAAIKEEAVLRARLASAEASFDAARARVARMMNTTTFIRDVKEAEVIEEERNIVASKEVEETGRGPAVTVATTECQATPTSAHFICTNEGDTEKATIVAHRTDPEWVLDSGASKHVAGKFGVFESYNKHPPTHKGTIQTADGTKQPVVGVGTVKCTSIISLSSVLHVPAFPVNLVSMSALIDQIDCRVILDKFGCLIQERQTRQTVGTGTRRRGLWYVDQGVQPDLVCCDHGG